MYPPFSTLPLPLEAVDSDPPARLVCLESLSLFHILFLNTQIQARELDSECPFAGKLLGGRPWITRSALESQRRTLRRDKACGGNRPGDRYASSRHCALRLRMTTEAVADPSHAAPCLVSLSKMRGSPSATKRSHLRAAPTRRRSSACGARQRRYHPAQGRGSRNAKRSALVPEIGQVDRGSRCLLPQCHGCSGATTTFSQWQTSSSRSYIGNWIAKRRTEGERGNTSGPSAG
jgi:hypothetical protein